MPDHDSDLTLGNKSGVTASSTQPQEPSRWISRFVDHGKRTSDKGGLTLIFRSAFRQFEPLTVSVSRIYASLRPKMVGIKRPYHGSK